jgi:hypothetical protein
MAPFTGAAAFHTMLAELINVVSDALAATDAGRPDRTCVVPGQIAWDDCECGQLATTIVQWFFSDTFPGDTTPSTAVQTPCRAAWVVAECTMSILRCAPQPVGDDLAPTCAKLSAAALTQAIDAHVVRRTVACTLAEWADEYRLVEYTIGAQTSVGPEGMCVGSEITFFVSLNQSP